MSVARKRFVSTSCHASSVCCDKFGRMLVAIQEGNFLGARLTAKRTPLSAVALRALVNTELASLAPCKDVEVACIEILPKPDLRGCNWRIGACNGLAAIAVRSLQWRYCVREDAAP